MGFDQIQVELQETMGSDIAIANAAWTSTYDKNRREDKYDDPDKVNGLVERLIRDGHSVPVESVIFRFWYRWPIFVDRQHMTHRIASHNGLSGRYRTMPSDWYELPRDVCSILMKTGGSLSGVVRSRYTRVLEESWNAYESSLTSLKASEKSGEITNKEYKRCREVLRGVLGTAFMVERTSIFNLRSFCNYMKLRKAEHAQAEIRHAAEQMYLIAKKAEVCPVAFKTLEEKGWLL